MFFLYQKLFEFAQNFLVFEYKHITLSIEVLTVVFSQLRFNELLLPHYHFALVERILNDLVNFSLDIFLRLLMT